MELRHEWRTPEDYLRIYRQPIDLAELIAVIELGRYLLKYGNLMGKETPGELKDFLHDLRQLAADSDCPSGRFVSLNTGMSSLLRPLLFCVAAMRNFTILLKSVLSPDGT